MTVEETVIGVKVPVDLRRRLKERASRERRSLSAQARIYIERGLEAEEA